MVRLLQNNGMPWPSLQDCKHSRSLLPLLGPTDIERQKLYIVSSRIQLPTMHPQPELTDGLSATACFEVSVTDLILSDHHEVAVAVLPVKAPPRRLKALVNSIRHLFQSYL